jgi:hypothetical protein
MSAGLQLQAADATAHRKMPLLGVDDDDDDDRVEGLGVFSSISIHQTGSIMFGYQAFNWHFFI